jgi:hypothetical protein
MADVPESRRYHDTVYSSARRWTAITPHDSNNLSELPKGIYVGGAGDVVAVGDDDATATFAASAGAVLPIRPKRINSTGTTATAIVALY